MTRVVPRGVCPERPASIWSNTLPEHCINDAVRNANSEPKLTKDYGINHTLERWGKEKYLGLLRRGVAGKLNLRNQEPL